MDVVVRMPDQVARQWGALNYSAEDLEADYLAKEIHAAAVLIDNRAGRHAVMQCGLPVIGTLGLLDQAALRVDRPASSYRSTSANKCQTRPSAN